MEEQSVNLEQQVNDLQEQQENTNVILERIEDQLLEQDQKNQVKQDQEADAEEQTREAQKHKLILILKRLLTSRQILI